jgi:rod shape-determining protein MreC
LALLVFLYKLDAFGLLRRASAPMILSASGGITRAASGIASWFGGIFAPSKLSEENSRLYYDLSQALIDKAELQSLRDENATLKEELRYKKSAGVSMVTARVAGQNNLDDSASLIINRGARDGIVPGNPVVFAGGILIGKIEKAEENFSIVLLLTDSKSSIAASMQNTGITSGIVKGERGLSLKMDLIPQDKEIKVGDLVITSGLETGIPKGLLIGSVRSVIKEIRDPFQSALIKSPIDFADLDYLQVITEK